MLFVQLDVNWPDDPKIIEAGWEAAGCHAAVLCLAKRLETDGWVHEALLDRYGITGAHLTTLLDVGLLDREGSRVRPSNWLRRNPSQAAIAAKRASKSEAGKAGNHRRYDHPGDLADCPKCNPAPQVVAGSECETDSATSHLAEISQPARSESEPETEPEATAASASGAADFNPLASEEALARSNEEREALKEGIARLRADRTHLRAVGDT